jgi:hypothetical protein
MMNIAAMSLATRKRWMAARIVHGGYSGDREQPEHYIWRSMLIRCREKHSNYEHVSVCKRWEKYENFVEDMGYRPTPKHTLDRWPNPFGNYEPSNCRWTTWTEQARNKRKTVFYTDGNRVGTVGMWAVWLNISVPLARYRWRRLGTFAAGKKFKFKSYGTRWKRAHKPVPRTPNPRIRIFQRGSTRGNILFWAEKLGIRYATAYNRMQRWGTFEKGRVWCEL